MPAEPSAAAFAKMGRKRLSAQNARLIQIRSRILGAPSGQIFSVVVWLSRQEVGIVMAMTGAQIRAGRAFVRLSAAELAKLARVGRMTIVRAELTDDRPATTDANLHAIQTALEALGVIFGADGSVNYRPKFHSATDDKADAKQ